MNQFQHRPLIGSTRPFIKDQEEYQNEKLVIYTHQFLIHKLLGLLAFIGRGAVLGKQHKDPRRETVGHGPFVDQADTSPHAFCIAVKNMDE